MLRRQARLRKEYLFRKAKEGTALSALAKKDAIRAALEDGRPIPTHLRAEAEAIRRELVFDEHHLATRDAEQAKTHIDDEYANAGVADPRVLITTSRDPSGRLAQFAKELRLVFPNAQRINRGNYVIGEIVDAARKNDMTDIVIVHETRGQPDGLIVSHLPHGPTAYFTLHNVVLRHDIPDAGTVSEVYPHLIFERFSSKLGDRVKNVLRHLFPVPKDDSKRVMTFANDGDFISFRHHVFYPVAKKDVQLVEVGPRFEMRVYQIKLGTLDLAEADTEWVLRPYHRTAKKRDML